MDNTRRFIDLRELRRSRSSCLTESELEACHFYGPDRRSRARPLPLRISYSVIQYDLIDVLYVSIVRCRLEKSYALLHSSLGSGRVEPVNTVSPFV
jgi:hypothetical protein